MTSVELSFISITPSSNPAITSPDPTTKRSVSPVSFVLKMVPLGNVAVYVTSTVSPICTVFSLLHQATNTIAVMALKIPMRESVFFMNKDL
jgi:hypothetical protein